MVSEGVVNSIREELEERHNDEDHHFSFFDWEQSIWDEVVDIIEEENYDLTPREVNSLLEKL